MTLDPARTLTSRFASLALAVVLTLGSCGRNNTDANPDDDRSDDTSVDDSDDPCPGGIDKELHIEQDLPRICSYFGSCPNPPQDFTTVEDCVEVISTVAYERTTCWDRCSARDCRAWLDTEPVCDDEDDVDWSCVHVTRCP